MSFYPLDIINANCNKKEGFEDPSTDCCFLPSNNDVQAFARGTLPPAGCWPPSNVDAASPVHSVAVRAVNPPFLNGQIHCDAADNKDDE